MMRLRNCDILMAKYGAVSKTWCISRHSAVTIAISKLSRVKAILKPLSLDDSPLNQDSATCITTSLSLGMRLSSQSTLIITVFISKYSSKLYPNPSLP